MSDFEWFVKEVVRIEPTLLLGSGDKAEAERKASEAKADAERKAAESEWRAEIRSDMKRLLDGQQQLSHTQGLQAKDISSVTARLDQLERRQDAQAEAHREAIRALRSEFEARFVQRSVPS